MSEAVTIQRIFRGFLARGLLIDRERILLTRELRDFGNGSIHSLLIRKDVQDIKSQALLHMAIKMAHLPSRPLKKLPPIQKIRFYRKALQRRRDLSSEYFNKLKLNYLKLVLDRRKMIQEDHAARFRDRYDLVLMKQIEKTQKEKAQKIERERIEELRRRMRLTALATAGKFSEDAYNEVREQEAMFRADFQSRRYDQSYRILVKHIIETERELMIQEDLLAKAVEQMNKEELIHLKILEEESLKVRDVVLDKYGSHVNYIEDNHTGSVHRWLDKAFRKQSKDDIRKTNNQNALALLQQFNAGHQPTTNSSFVTDKLAHYKYEECLWQSNQVQVQLELSPETNNVARCLLLLQLRSSRDLARKSHRQLLECLCNFQIRHAELLSYRSRLTKGKFATRTARKSCQSTAAELEAKLPDLRSEIILHSDELIGFLRVEVECFCRLFLVPSGNPQSDSEEDIQHLKDLDTLRRIGRPKVVVSESSQQTGGKRKDTKESNHRKNPSVTSRSNAPINLAAMMSSAQSSSSAAKQGPTIKKKSQQQQQQQQQQQKLNKLKQKQIDQRQRQEIGSNVKGDNLNDTLCQFWRVENICDQLFHVVGDVTEAIILPALVPVKTCIHDGTVHLQRNKPAVQSSDPHGVVTTSPSVKKKLETQFVNVPIVVDKSIGNKRAPTTIEHSSGKPCELKGEDKFDVPGFNLFLDANPSVFDFYQWGEAVKSWMTSVARWMDSHEAQWKDMHRCDCISFLQRLSWLAEASTTHQHQHQSQVSISHDDIMHSFKKFHHIKSDDAAAAVAVYHADVLDLYELLLSRVSFVVRVAQAPTLTDQQSGNFAILLSSNQCDFLFGRHCASIAGRFLMMAESIKYYKDLLQTDVKTFSGDERAGSESSPNQIASRPSSHYKNRSVAGSPDSSEVGSRPSSRNGNRLKSLSPVTASTATATATITAVTSTYTFSCSSPPVENHLKVSGLVVHMDDPYWSSAVHNIIRRVEDTGTVAAKTGSLIERFFEHPVDSLAIMQFELLECHAIVKEAIDRRILVLGTIDVDGLSSNEDPQLFPVLRLYTRLKQTHQHCSNFVNIQVTNESWVVVTPTWMQPGCRLGCPAGPEPFWRRLLTERKSGIEGGKYTKLLDKNNAVDRIAKRLLSKLKLKVVKARPLRSLLKDKLTPMWESDLMSYEDARSQQYRVNDFSRIQKAIDTYDAKMKSESSLWSILSNPLNSFVQSRWAKIGDKNDQQPQRRPINYYKKPPPVVEASTLACLQNGSPSHAFTISDRAALEAQKELKLENDLVVDEAIERQILYAIFNTSRESVWYSDIQEGFNDYRNQKDAAAYRNALANVLAYTVPAFTKEIFVFGGLESIVMVLRIAEDESFNPRGLAMVECSQDSLARNARINFTASRPLCSASMATFASFECQSGKLLSAWGIKRLRVYEPLRALSESSYYQLSDLWTLAVNSRYNGLSVMKYIVTIQRIARGYLARKLIQHA